MRRAELDGARPASTQASLETIVEAFEIQSPVETIEPVTEPFVTVREEAEPVPTA